MLREQVDLCGGEVGASLLDLAGELDASSGVRSDAAILDRDVEDRGEHSERADGDRGGLGTLAEGERRHPRGERHGKTLYNREARRRAAVGS